MKDNGKKIYRGMKGLLRERELLDRIPPSKVIKSRDDIRSERKKGRAQKWDYYDEED